MSLHRSTSYHGWWLILIRFAFFFGVIGFGVWMIGQSFFPWRSHGAEIEFVVAPGESARTIGRNLKAANIIESSFLFETYAAIRGVAPKFQAGTFRLPQRVSLLAAVNVLTGGKAESTTVTIPEGWTAEEIATRLEARGAVAKA